MRVFVLAAALAGTGCATSAAPVTGEWPACGRVETLPGAQWTESDPVAAGWSAAQLEEAQALFRSQPSAAVMVVHRGRLVASWGSVAERYTAQSVRKGLLSSLVGQLVGEKKLQIDATLAEMAIDDRSPPLTAGERQATLRDLLMSRSGIFHSALYEVGGWTRERKALAKQEAEAGTDLYPPGALWIYNNWDFNAVGTIVEKAAGEEIGPLFLHRIAAPTQMEDFRAADVEYTTSDHPAEQRFGNVSDHRAYVFNISTRDLARYGLLYMNCGRWAGRQVIPESWVLASITGRDTREGRGPDQLRTGFGDYGYLWQIDRPGARNFDTLTTREPFYIATGNRGHVLAVFPHLDLVIVHQVATVGGVGAEAQMKRAVQGSPEVTEQQIAALFGAIIEAHPEASRAFEPAAP